MGGTVLCKYDISDSKNPILLNRRDIADDHTDDPLRNYIRKGRAISTAMVDIGDYNEKRIGKRDFPAKRRRSAIPIWQNRWNMLETFKATLIPPSD